MIKYEPIETDEQFDLYSLELICKSFGKTGQPVKIINRYNNNGDSVDEINGVHEVRTLLKINANKQPVKYEERHSNGQVKKEYHFKDGKKSGIAEEFDKLGRRTARIHFREGMLQGVQAFYSGDKIKQFEIWDNNMLRFSSRKVE